MRKYDRLEGVPLNSYYLVRVIQFGDFETYHKDEIIYLSEDRQELVDLCRQNRWELEGGWATFRIYQRGVYPSA